MNGEQKWPDDLLHDGDILVLRWPDVNKLYVPGAAVKALLRAIEQQARQ